MTTDQQRIEHLTATLREVLDTFAPMSDTYGGPTAYYDGSADIDPTRYARWRAVLDANTPPPTSVCGACKGVVGWVDCPTGGWWSHEEHPNDGHDAQPTPGDFCSAALMPLNADPLERCVFHSRHDGHRAPSGEAWTDADAELPQDGNGWPGDEHAEPGMRGWTA